MDEQRSHQPPSSIFEQDKYMDKGDGGGNGKEDLLLSVSSLTVKISGKSSSGEISFSTSPHLNSPSSNYSPPSSKFVSALQSPYISPRATLTSETNTTDVTTTTIPSPISTTDSHSDDVPTTSYTPSERYDFSTDPNEQKPKFSDGVQPRISFSFPVPRISLTKNSVTPTANAKLRSCDVYIGFHGQNTNLIRFCKWLKAELEHQGIVSFVADRAKYSNTQSHDIADRIICSATYGVVVVTASSFLNPHSIEEIRFFAQKKNLIPLLFDIDPCEITKLFEGHHPDEKDWKEALEGLSKCRDFKLEANETNWRSCVSRSVEILKSKLGRKTLENEDKMFDVFAEEQMPFPRNSFFVGREKELTEIEAAFFGCCDATGESECPRPLCESKGFADEESDRVRANSRYISLEMRKSKEPPTLEAWIEPAPAFGFTATTKGRGLQKQRSKHRKSKWSGGGSGGKNHHGNTNSIFINGSSGIGKTEVALEFAYRYAERYKMVLWIAGEAKYFRQSILNLATKLGLDVSAEAEKERGRIRSFDEQEIDAFDKVKRELFRDIPYLVVIDNLESEKEWWDGGGNKDLHDLIPNNTGASHVIITTRLSRVMGFEPMQLEPLSLPEALVLIRGRRKKNYEDGESEVLKKLDERLGRLSFGLWLIGSLLSELDITPSELLEAIDKMTAHFNESSDEGMFPNNPFLIKVITFCFAILDQKGKRRNLAYRMALAGGWFGPVPISSNLLAAAANSIPTKEKNIWKWQKNCCFFGCYLKSHERRREVQSAAMLVKLGLARRGNGQRHNQHQCNYWIQFHPITKLFTKRRGGLVSATASVVGTARMKKPVSSYHLWSSSFLILGFKSEPPLVQLKPNDAVQFIQNVVIPLAIQSFMTFSRCRSALDLLKVSTNVLEEIEKSFVSQIQDWRNHRSLCWNKKRKKKKKSNCGGREILDEYVWSDVTLLKATLLETRAKLLLRGGHFDSGEELCRTCISIRTVMFGHNHLQTLAAQETLAKLIRLRSKI